MLLKICYVCGLLPAARCLLIRQLLVLDERHSVGMLLLAPGVVLLLPQIPKGF